MPEKFKQAFNLSVGIPVWGVVTFLAGGIFYAGASLNKLNTLLDNFAKMETRVATIQEKQIERGGVLNAVQTQVQNHESRLTALERNVMERGK